MYTVMELIDKLKLYPEDMPVIMEVGGEEFNVTGDIASVHTDHEYLKPEDKWLVLTTENM